MLDKLKAALSRLGAGSGSAPAAPAQPAVEYKGYRIQPAPIAESGGYRTAGTIEKDMADGVRRHAFVRADTSTTLAGAVEFSIAKGKLIVDQLGDRMFES